MPPKIVYPWVKVIAGLAAALLAARFLCPVPPRHLFSSGWALIPIALGYVAAIAVAAIVSVHFTRARFPLDVRCAVAAVWAAPLAVLATEQSAWAAIPLIALVILATPLFGLNREPPAPSADSRLLRQRPSSFTVAVLIQLAAIAAMIRFPGVAGILVSIGAAMLVWRVTAVDPQRVPGPGGR